MLHAQLPIYSHLTEPGGDDSLAVDGSSTPVIFRYKCPIGKRAFLFRMLVSILDASMSHITYGGITALTNGVGIDVLDTNDVSILDLLGGDSLVDNAGWERLCYDTSILTKGALDNLTVRWSFWKDLGGPLILEAGYSFALTVNDDLTDLDAHHVLIRGYTQKTGLGSGR